MTWEGVPWFVDKAEHGPEVARLLAYAAAGGREGIAQPTDLKVTASAIPDGNIHIAPGAAAVLSQYAGADSQGYMVRNVGDEVHAMTPQGSSGVRYDLVCLVVQDPQYAGQPAPPSVPDGPYVVTKVYENVGANVRKLSEVDANQTGLALARVKFDASDGTVNTADIVDLRQTLFSRSYTEERIVSVTSGSTAAPTGGLALFPPGSQWTIDVPEWATHVNLSAILSGFNGVDGGADGGTANGTFVVDLGGISTDTANWKTNAVGPGKTTTITIQAAEGNLDCSAMAGTSQVLRTRLYKSSGSGMTMYALDGTNCVVRATFLEKAL